MPAVKYKSGDVPMSGDIVMCVDARPGKSGLPFLLANRGVYVVSTVDRDGVWIRPRSLPSPTAVLSPRRFRLLAREESGVPVHQR